MNKLEELKTEAEKWRTITVVGSILQTCLFMIWVVIVLVLTNAPLWAVVIGAVYAFSHWFHYITWLIAVRTDSLYREAKLDKGSE